MRTQTRIDRARFSRALSDAMHQKGIDQPALATRLGVSQPTISDWLNQKKTPGRANLDRIMSEFGITWEDISPEGRPKRKEARAATPGPTEGQASSDIVLIPRSGFVAAGDGAYNDDMSTVQYDPYPRHEIIRLTQRSPDQLLSAVVVGDSMEPELRANDTVIFQPVDRVIDHGLYIFSLDDSTMVKFIQRLAGGAIEIIPLNPRYTRERLVPLEDADTTNLYRSELTGMTGILRIIGKVVFYPKPA